MRKQCILCRCEVPTWDGIIPNDITIRGLTMEEISRLVDFALENGYRFKKPEFQIQMS